MTFIELCERVAEEVNRVPLVFTSVDLGKSGGAFTLTDPFQRSVIRAVQKAYWDLVSFSNTWEFLNVRGKILDLDAGVPTYTMEDNLTIDWSSTHLRMSGSTVRWPVVEGTYEDWQRREQASPATSGIPSEVVEAPAGTWIVWPIPLEAYELWGDYHIKPTPLEAEDDEPLWSEDQHEVIVWLAVKYLEARVDTADEKVSTMNATSANDALKVALNKLIREYMPSIRGPLE